MIRNADRLSYKRAELWLSINHTDLACTTEAFITRSIFTGGAFTGGIAVLLSESTVTAKRAVKSNAATYANST